MSEDGRQAVAQTGRLPKQRRIRSGPKVKTGCETCRLRKVKCDEQKPCCRRCRSTGRTCGGYRPVFRPFCAQVTTKHMSPAQNVDLLNRDFSIKTILDVQINCHAEAKQILEASLVDASVQHALLSLRSLRTNVETCLHGSVWDTQMTAAYHHGTKQYNKALSSLTARISSPSHQSLKSALLCCELFISIEQTRRDYAGMVQHFVRGLDIMQQYRARPLLDSTNNCLIAASAQPLPLVDAFLIKLFCAPCKFKDMPLARCDSSSTLQAGAPKSRSIAPNMRAELVKIASTTLKFLSAISNCKTDVDAQSLVTERITLLDALEAWLVDLDDGLAQMGHANAEPISATFLRLFRYILKVTLLSNLRASAELEVANDEIHATATTLDTRIRDYGLFSMAI